MAKPGREFASDASGATIARQQEQESRLVTVQLVRADRPPRKMSMSNLPRYEFHQLFQTRLNRCKRAASRLFVPTAAVAFAPLQPAASPSCYHHHLPHETENFDERVLAESRHVRPAFLPPAPELATRHPGDIRNVHHAEGNRADRSTRLQNRHRPAAAAEDSPSSSDVAAATTHPPATA